MIQSNYDEDFEPANEENIVQTFHSIIIESETEEEFFLQGIEKRFEVNISELSYNLRARMIFTMYLNNIIQYSLWNH